MQKLDYILNPTFLALGTMGIQVETTLMESNFSISLKP